MKLLAPPLMAAALAIFGFCTPSLAQPVLLAQAASDAPAQAPQTGDGQIDLAKGQASYMAVCAACHANDGNSVIPLQPKLSGQHPEYMVKQLMEFKSDKRANPIMKAFADALSEADMRNIAAWLQTQKPAENFASDQGLVFLGERIYRGGLQDRSIAACAACHGPNGAGIPAQYPHIAGQRADYTEAQLIAFRDGTRSNSIQMTQVAAKLNDREIKALADYIAGLR